MDPLAALPNQTELPLVAAVQSEQPSGDVKLSVFSYLGADSMSKEAEFIMGQLKGDNIMDALTELKDIERRVGPPKFGETKVQKLYNYMKLLSTFKATRKELDALEQ